MKLFFRLFWLILTQSFRARTDIVGPVDTKLRVYPNDLDIFLHVNNGVYFTYGDLARTDLMLRSNSFKLIRKKGWYPVVAAETMQFKKSLTVGQQFTVTTQVIAWTERAVYMEHTFKRGDKLIARALIDARFLSKSGGKVSTIELMSLLGIDRESPLQPEYLQRWLESTQTLADKPLESIA